MTRPVVRVTITGPAGTVLHSEIRHAMNSGIRASEKAMGDLARSAGLIRTGLRPSREGNVYSRTWTAPDAPDLLATVEVVQTGL
jgi:hypothetical protein